MEDNPFIGIVKKIRDDNSKNYPTTHRTGRVITINPLQIEVNGLHYDRTELLKNSLLYNFEVGDELLLLPIEEEQRYIILAKVVQV